MKFHFSRILIPGILFLAFGWQAVAEEAPAKKPSRYEKQKRFVLSLLPQALSLQASKGVPASATVGMAIYESGWGQSALAQEHNNLHGLKAGRHGTGRW